MLRQKQNRIKYAGLRQQKVNVNKNRMPSKSNELRNGISKLILIIVKVLVDLLERQAQRKVMAGNLTSDDVERLGLAFISIRKKLRDVTIKFGFKYEDLDIPIASVGGRLKDANDLGNEQILSAPILVDVLDKLINKQTVIAGQIVISVANIELIVLNLLGTLLSSND